jgi:hypothetical protein
MMSGFAGCGLRLHETEHDITTKTLPHGNFVAIYPVNLQVLDVLLTGLEKGQGSKEAEPPVFMSRLCSMGFSDYKQYREREEQDELGDIECGQPMVVGAGDIAFYCGLPKAVGLEVFRVLDGLQHTTIIHMTRPYTSFLLN